MVRRTLPQARLIHEIYDFFPIIPDDWIALGIDASPRLIELMRLSNYYSSQNSQLIISKRSGADWDTILTTFRAPYLFVFPGLGYSADSSVIEVNAPDAAPPEGKTRILYAGVMVPSNFEIYKRSDYNFLPLLEALAEEPGYSIDIYNSGHSNALQNPIYADYLERYSTAPMRYHLRIPYEALLSLMPDYHYGWLCLPPREQDLADQLVVICNRFSAYIYGGLPIIVDAEWHYIASLVETFDAGIVIKDATAEKVVEAIRGACNSKKREGARRLSAFMQRHNMDVIDIVRKAIA
jgi:hypothetical protein